MKIGMVDADLLDGGTRHPNLAQMKISAYCKERGHDVFLIYLDYQFENLEDYDLIIVSKVFKFSKVRKEIEELLTSPIKTTYNYCIKEILDSGGVHPKIAIGGTGFFEDGGRDLHPEIEHHMPDYHLYDEFIKYKISEGRKESYYVDYLNFSIGFTTRGCFRQCDFCVNKKYKKCSLHSPVSEFLDLDRPKIYLWDDNVFASANWRSVFEELIATGKPFQFRQGLDIRLLNEERAEVLSRCKYYGDFIFAFDHVDDYDMIEQKLKLWRKYCQKETKLYVLCAFDSWQYTSKESISKNKNVPHLEKMIRIPDQNTRDQLDIEGVFKRIELLFRYGCLPYIMRYEKYKESKYRGMYTQIARWCNQPNILKKMNFEEFCEANQRYAKTDKICSATRVMREFKQERPDIAGRYFGMRFKKV